MRRLRCGLSSMYLRDTAITRASEVWDTSNNEFDIVPTEFKFVVGSEPFIPINTL